jgi:hypothetical protein
MSRVLTRILVFSLIFQQFSIVPATLVYAQLAPPERTPPANSGLSAPIDRRNPGGSLGAAGRPAGDPCKTYWENINKRDPKDPCGEVKLYKEVV